MSTEESVACAMNNCLKMERERAERQKLQKASILLKGKMSQWEDLLFNYKLMNIFVEKFFKESRTEIF